MRPVDPARSRIVLVGTPAYNDPWLDDIPAISNNIADFAAALTDPLLGGFDPAHCVTAAPNSSIGEIGDLLIEAAAEAEDLLLFYYAGHGLLGPRDRALYLSVAGTRHDRLPFTALPFDAIRDSCLDSKATSRVVILDCCFSGRAIGDTLSDTDAEVMGQVDVAGTYTLAAAPGNRTALVLPGERHTVFTGRMLNLMQSGVAGAGPVLSLGTIYRHLHSELKARNLPLPQQRGTGAADLLGLVRNRHVAVPMAAPAGTNAAAEARLAEREAEAIRIGHAGNAAEAARLFRRIIVDRERITGTEELATLVARRWLSYWVQQGGDVLEGMRLLWELIDDQRRVLPADHPEALIARRYVAVDAGDTRGWDEGARLLRELLPDMIRVLGPDHEEMLRTRRYLAYEMGPDPVKDVRMLSELVADVTRALGPDHRDTLAARRTHAYNVASTTDHPRGLALYQELIADDARILGAGHIETLSARREMAFHVGRNGEAAEAARLYRDLIPDLTRALGRTHWETLRARRELAYQMATMGDRDAAIPMLRDLIPDQISAQGPDHKDVLIARRYLAFEIAGAGERAEAIGMLRELIADLTRVLGADSEETLISRRYLAFDIGADGDRAEAARQYRALIADQLRVLGPDHNEVRLARKEITQFE